MVRFLPLLSPLLLSFAAHGETSKVYRWVDGAGHVHYSDQADLKAQELKNRVPAGNRATAHGSEAASTADGDDPHAQDCERKKEQLITYRNASKVTETDGLGNTREYSPEQKQKLMDLTEQSIHDLCSPG